MSEHVIEWLTAYHDGELKGRKLQQVEEHLSHCEACRSEFRSLQSLSTLLKDASAPVFTPNERFVRQVNLRLPQKRTAASRPQLFEIGWWMVPVSLMLAWAFISTAVLLGNLVATADQFGVLDRTTASWISSQSETANLTAVLADFGFLKANSLQWAEWSESYTRNIFPQFFWYASIALAYLAWITAWWARHTRQARNLVLEG